MLIVCHRVIDLLVVQVTNLPCSIMFSSSFKGDKLNVPTAIAAVHAVRERSLSSRPLG
jgi:hypothetical protein